MFLVANQLSDVDITQLSGVYVQTIQDIEKDHYQRMSSFGAEIAAREHFFKDLEYFFQKQDGIVFILADHGRYLSSLRAEPHLDGVLITYLETAPRERGKGYAKRLVALVLDYFNNREVKRIYSHISKRNKSSLSVHFASGFRIDKDYAKLLDGTVSQNYYSLIYESTAG